MISLTIPLHQVDADDMITHIDGIPLAYPLFVKAAPGQDGVVPLQPVYANTDQWLRPGRIRDNVTVLRRPRVRRPRRPDVQASVQRCYADVTVEVWDDDLVDEALGQAFDEAMDRIPEGHSRDGVKITLAVTGQVVSARARWRSSGVKVRLGEDDVLAIRQRYADGEIGRALATEYGLSQTSIYNLVTGKTWPHAGGPIHTGRPRGRRSSLLDLDVEIKEES